MLARTIDQVYKHHGRSFLENIKKARTLDEKPIHQLRLNIKSIRAMLTLLDMISKKKVGGLALLSLLKPVFDRAGKVRTTTLNLQLTQQYKSAILKKFKKHLQKKQAIEGEKLIKELRKLQLKKVKKLHKKNLSTVRKADTDELTKDAIEHLRQQLAEVRADLFDINDDETLHEIRRQLRHIKNIGSLLEEAKADHPFKEELKKVNATYEKIGKWHDTIDLVDALEKFINTLHDPKGLDKTIPLILKLKKDSLKSKRQIARKLRSDLVRPN
jgi:hypothetical protein